MPNALSQLISTLSTRRYRTLILSLIFLTLGWFGLEMAMALDVTQFPVVLDRSLGNAFLIGVVLSLGPIAGLTVQPFMGWYGDVLVNRGYTRERVMMIAAVGTLLSLIGLGFARHTWAIIIFMGFFFIAANVIMVSYRAYVTQTSQRIAFRDKQGVISGLMGLFSGSGALFMAIFCGASAHVQSLFLPPNTPAPPDRIPFFVASAAFLVIMLIFFKWAPKPSRLNQANTESNAQNAHLFRPINLLFYAFPPIALIPRIEKQLSQTPEQHAIFRLFVVIFFSWIGLQALRGYFVLFAEQNLHVTLATANLLLAMAMTVMVIAAVPLGRLADMVNPNTLFKATLIVFSIVCGLALFFTVSKTEAHFTCVLLGVCLAGLIVCPLSVLFKLCPPNQEGVYAGLYNVFISLPQLYSLLITGGLIEALDSYRVIFVVACITAFLAFLCSYRLDNLNVNLNSRPSTFIGH